MKIFLTLLLFIPSFSWAGNTERHYCESWTYTDKSTGKSKEISSNKKNPFIFFYELNHEDKTFSIFDLKTGILKGNSHLYTKSGSNYVANSENSEYSINLGQEVSTVESFGETQDLYSFAWKCIPEAKYKSIFKEKEPIDTVNQCLDLGFKKGTEGLKNCVLELN